MYQPLPVPHPLWKALNIDFTLAGASKMAQLFFREVAYLHGLPKPIASGRDTKFMSYFQKTLWMAMKAKLHFFNAYNPETDGQTKVVNCSLGKSLLSHGGTCENTWM
eukprot:TRINITY_DN37822_c0_g2_i1.p1 TRINITY_DN37822_c0_g2~~TRINITY_DN37822_c0_g2_i1.p1  ORF type:complete len:107 (-),score=16.12 TRINITY_DN37822_c0_g2_i1:215-535(-)